MTASEISIENAKKDKLFYFVANVVVFRESDGRCLLLKRSEREKVHPGKYAMPGGKLEWADMDISNPTRMNGDVIDFENSVENLVARETREEAGIEIENKLYYINSVAFVRPDGIPVILVKFAAKFKSGEVTPNPHDFSDFAWINEKELESFDYIKGIDVEVRETIKIFK
ncbi:MAG TPA: NUDIX hydrolase [Candidatus Bathyarchaeia archaeon]|nr:NUDIX hydrolase [Candidatus Bathyarchaeia archaeon]